MKINLVNQSIQDWEQSIITCKFIIPFLFLRNWAINSLKLLHFQSWLHSLCHTQMQFKFQTQSFIEFWCLKSLNFLLIQLKTILCKNYFRSKSLLVENHQSFQQIRLSLALNSQWNLHLSTLQTLLKHERFLMNLNLYFELFHW